MTFDFEASLSLLVHTSSQGHQDASFQHVHTHVLNPKSVKMGELYGEYNLLTNEWQDGIASSLIRAAVADQV